MDNPSNRESETTNTRDPSEHDNILARRINASVKTKN